MIGVQLFGPSCALPTGGQGATLQGSHWSDTVPKLGLLLHVSAVSPMPVAKFQTWHLAFLLMPSCEPMVPKVPKKFKPPQMFGVQNRPDRQKRTRTLSPILTQKTAKPQSCALPPGGQRTTRPKKFRSHCAFLLGFELFAPILLASLGGLWVVGLFDKSHGLASTRDSFCWDNRPLRFPLLGSIYFITYNPRVVRRPPVGNAQVSPQVQLR